MVLTDPFPKSQASGDAAVEDLKNANRSTGILMSYAAVKKIDAGIGCDSRIVFDDRTKQVKLCIGHQYLQKGLMPKMWYIWPLANYQPCCSQ